MAIYKSFRGRTTEAWHQLTEDEREALLAKTDDARSQVGGKTLLVCDCAWSSDEWWFFGMEEFPDIEAVQKCAKLRADFEWPHYWEGESLLGTKME